MGVGNVKIHEACKRTAPNGQEFAKQCRYGWKRRQTDDDEDNTAAADDDASDYATVVKSVGDDRQGEEENDENICRGLPPQESTDNVNAAAIPPLP